MNAQKFSEALNEIDDKYIYSALNYHRKRWSRLLPFAASLAALTGLCGFTYAVSVYQGAGSAAHIDFDKLTQPFGTIASEQQNRGDDNDIFYEKSPLIDDYEDIYADYSVCIAMEGRQIPAVYFSPAYMIIFSQENAHGWTLEKGETLTLDLSLYKTQSLELETGYISDGEYHSLSVTKGQHFAETLTVPKAGEYFLCVTNHSSGNAVVERGSIVINQ